MSGIGIPTVSPLKHIPKEFSMGTLHRRPSSVFNTWYRRITYILKGSDCTAGIIGITSVRLLTGASLINQWNLTYFTIRL